MSAVTATLKLWNARSESSSRSGLPHTHHRIGETAVVMRSLLPQYLVRTAATCSRLIARTVLASAVSLLSWNQRAPGPAVMAGRPDEPDVAAALGLRHLREVLDEPDHHRETRSVVERRLEVAVHVREDRDVFGRARGARQRAHDARGLEARAHLARELEAHLDGLPSAEQVSQNLPVFESDVEARPPGRRLPDREVVRDAEHQADRGGAVLEGALDDAVDVRGVADVARERDVLNEHRLALDVTADEVSRGAGPDPDEVPLAALRRRGRRRASRASRT